MRLCFLVINSFPASPLSVAKGIISVETYVRQPVSWCGAPHLSMVLVALIHLNTAWKWAHARILCVKKFCTSGPWRGLQHTVSHTHYDIWWRISEMISGDASTRLESGRFVFAMDAWIKTLTNSVWKKTFFQQDNALCHTARSIKVLMKDHQIKTLSWPAQSPDLSTIENLLNEHAKTDESCNWKSGLWRDLKTTN